MRYLNRSSIRQLNPTARLLRLLFILTLPALLALSGCTAHADPAAEAPPPANVVPGADPSLFTVDHPEQFPLTAATERAATSELVVTGAVTPDVTRNVPVVPLASGRVVGIHAKLGDTVQKGQLLLTIRSDDVMGGFDAYRKAIADELLARKQLNRAVDLYAHGAIAQQDLEVAQDAAEDAKVTLETATEHLRLLGNDPDKPMGMVDVLAPVSGVITDQEVTNSSTVQAFNTPGPFTISDLSDVWVICDVYENDLGNVRMGDKAEIVLNAYPSRVFKGTISNIGAILDPSIRTAKVRMEVQNPGIMRLGMFVKATFHGQMRETHTIVPASAVLRMHDRDFVFVPAPDRKFRRVEVVSGDVLTENTSLQEIKSGLKPGQQVVTNALVLDHVLAQ
ncbi:MAG TPA: efflux RND transporter periplasmic adaptor subunit [Candidatus Sulfotelmatobacter sp.]|jgi:membrane fusion protein, heavy metal efflux system|nr:efflux RND transporter periplasmic adaptor subunit [Candidatus Sulfotelmatobacter sp.]